MTTNNEVLQSNAEVKAKPPKQNPLMVFFLDSAITFASPQKELLATASHLRAQGFVPYICCPEQCELMQQAKDQNFNVIPITKPAGGKPGLGALMRLFGLQKRNQPLCIHSFAENCLPLAHRLESLRKENTTVMLHSNFTKPKHKNLKKLPKYYEKVTKFTYPSKYIANIWAEFGIDPAKVAVIHPAHAPISPQPKSERFIFMAFEDLEEDSGIEILLKAMAAIWQHPYLPEWELRIVGSGSLFAQILADAESLGVASRLALLDNQSLENVLPHAHVLISPNLNANGNLPALMAAWLVGIPLICTAVTAHLEVAHKDNAITMPTEDPQRLAAVMIELMCRSDRMEEYTKISAEMHDYANILRLQKQYLQIYNQCIARHGWVLPAANSPK